MIEDFQKWNAQHRNVTRGIEQTAKKVILVGIGLMVLYAGLLVGGILAVAYGIKVIFAG